MNRQATTLNRYWNEGTTEQRKNLLLRYFKTKAALNKHAFVCWSALPKGFKSKIRSEAIERYIEEVL